MLAFGYLPSIPKVHYIAVCRAIGKVSRAAVVLTTFAAIEVAAAAMGGLMDGLIGLSWALLIVSVVEGIATTPAVVRAAIARGRHRRPVVMAERAGDQVPSRRTLASPLTRAPAAVAAAGDEAAYRVQRAQQEAGLAMLLSLATTIGPDHPIPGIPYTLPPQARTR
jgi:hypothetical protein